MTQIEKPETNNIVNRREREKNGLWHFETKHKKVQRKMAKQKHVNRLSWPNLTEYEVSVFKLLYIVTIIGRRTAIPIFYVSPQWTALLLRCNEHTLIYGTR
ncbi:hypothetical protein SBF1_750022 [Candidatus Desulfosporosinus infrequens]|uniref:Uncharacterized protein n=1 Tax=Candidatus Desulfosporosinus infrequens TaxID=2043169 RepID=A0A2U3LR23_9FIRM|nr:hypothetical protein SBF1_750022 [Candidatus Desulfosporosinus infrequens]